MKTGDRVTLSHGDVTVIAELIICSENQKSLLVEYDGEIARHHGVMPILMDDDGVYRSIVNGAAVTVRPLS